MTNSCNEIHKIVFMSDIAVVSAIEYNYGSVSETTFGREFKIFFCPVCGIDLMYYRYHQQEAKDKGLM